MNGRKYLSQITGNETRFIEGIYNYCDKWCEKCPFTEKCALYAMERVEDATTRNITSADLENEEFWNQIGKTLTHAMEILFDLAHEKGIDLNAISQRNENLEVEKRLPDSRRDDALTKMSLNYLSKTNKWFDKHKVSVERIDEEFQRITDLDIETEQDIILKDYIQIIKWYSHQNTVKLRRAYKSSLFEDSENDSVQTDSNGSVKVALIGIDRSLSAWTGLLSFMPELEDEILDMLVELENLKHSVKHRYPQAEHFKRPGFDQ